jgi:excisionase family DNA binding protein
MQSGWKKVKAAAQYMGMSERSVRKLLKEGLRHSRLPSSRTVLISTQAIDEFLEKFEVDSSTEADQIAQAIAREMTQ